MTAPHPSFHKARLEHPSYTDPAVVVFRQVTMAPAQCVQAQRVFHFGKGESDGNKSMKELVIITKLLQQRTN